MSCSWSEETRVGTEFGDVTCDWDVDDADAVTITSLRGRRCFLFLLKLFFFFTTSTSSMAVSFPFPLSTFVVVGAGVGSSAVRGRLFDELPSATSSMGETKRRFDEDGLLLSAVAIVLSCAGGWRGVVDGRRPTLFVRFKPGLDFNFPLTPVIASDDRVRAYSSDKS